MTSDRRTLLAGAGALGIIAATGAAAQQRERNARRPRSRVIDIHTHMFSPGWMEQVDRSNDPNFRLGDDEPRALLYRGLAIGAVLPADARDAVRGANAEALFDL